MMPHVVTISNVKSGRIDVLIGVYWIGFFYIEVLSLLPTIITVIFAFRVLWC